MPKQLTIAANECTVEDELLHSDPLFLNSIPHGSVLSLSQVKGEAGPVGLKEHTML